MDIGKLNPENAANDGAWMVVRHPVTMEETDWRIKLRGNDSVAMRQCATRLARADAKRKVPKTASEVQAEDATMLVALTITWEGCSENGKELPYDDERGLEVYKAQNWLRQQVFDFINDGGNFFKAS